MRLVFALRIVDDDVCAPPRKTDCDCGADARGGTCDNRGLAFQRILFHEVTPFFILPMSRVRMHLGAHRNELR